MAFFEKKIKSSWCKIINPIYIILQILTNICLLMILAKVQFIDLSFVAKKLSLLSLLVRSKSKKARLKDGIKPVVRHDGVFKTYMPITPGLRHRKMPVRDHLWKGKPIKELTSPQRKKGGRGGNGRIVVRHRGGGHKRRLRKVDFYRLEKGPCEVITVEYDPNRSAHIALIKNLKSGSLSYILAPHNLQPGNIVESFREDQEAYEESISAPKYKTHSYYLKQKKAQEEEDAKTTTIDDVVKRNVSIQIGNCMPLKMIPIGTTIHNIGMYKGGPGVLVRSAGTSGQLVKTGEKGHAQVRLQSEEVRLIPVDAVATIGQVSNPNHHHRVFGKAGVRRNMGWRPSVRGVAQNPCDHPHGGGRGKSKGNRQPVSPWGVLAKGGKTRRKKSPHIVKRRPRRFD